MIDTTPLTTYVQGQAREQFHRLHGRATWHKLCSMLIGREHRLLNLQAIEQQFKVCTRHYAGIQLVPIAQIGGSEGRCDDFDADFRPLKRHNGERWISVALAHSHDLALPVVELVQVKGTYFVRDGHHRISVAKLNGQVEIEAAVTVWHGVDLASTPPEVRSTTGQMQLAQHTVSLLLQVGKWLLTLRRKVQACYGADLGTPVLH